MLPPAIPLCLFLLIASAHTCASSYPDLSNHLARNAYRSDPSHLRIVIVTSEITGPVRNGGIGTAFTTLALALARAGHAVTLLFTRGRYSETGPFAEWQTFYQERNVSLTALELPPLSYLPRHLLTSYAVLRYLETQDANIIHFHEYEGAGYYSLLAKRQGLALQAACTVVGMHGPTLWAKQQGNRESLSDIGDLERNFMEKMMVKLADYVVSPSQYMLKWTSSQGWPQNSNMYVQQNLHPHSTDDPKKARKRESVWELVFFGRLEGRKGIATFCDAIDLMLQAGSPLRAASVGLRKITFLGKAALVDGVLGDAYVRRRAAAWEVDWSIESSFNSKQAMQYLRQEGRLAVMPSREENSPYTVLEAAAAAVPFLASNVGGIPDLVAAEDHPHALFEPTPQHLAHRIARAIYEGLIPARPAVNVAENEAIWLRWHLHISSQRCEAASATAADRSATASSVSSAVERPAWGECNAMDSMVDLASEGHDSEACSHSNEADIARLRTCVQDNSPDSARDHDAHPPPPLVSVVITHYNRAALCQVAVESILAQSYPADRLQLIVVDDGSSDPAAHTWMDQIEPVLSTRNGTLIRSSNQYLGAARNVGLRAARGEFVLFMDDDNVAKPHEVATFVQAMQSSGADILTSFVDFFSGPARAPPPRQHPSFIFLGGSAEVGVYKNCFGDANCFVRRSSFLELGGYTEDYGVGYEDWEMYSKAVLRGYDVQIVPQSLYQYRFTPGSMQKSTDFIANRKRSLRPYLEHMPAAMHEKLMKAVLPRVENGVVHALRGVGAEGLSKFPGAVTSDGEATALMRPPHVLHAISSSNLQIDS